jgi:hypothetical protein
MKQAYYKLVFKCLSWVAILSTAYAQYRWAVTLYKQGLWLFLPVAALVPGLMIYVFFGVRIPEQGSGVPSTPLYRSVRADFIKFVIITAAGMILGVLQSR